MTTLSVIIPVYRSEELIGLMIERTLAVFDQRKLDAELILVHDASPDASWSILEEWAARDSRIIALDLTRNEGQHQALMIGARWARGKFVATLDDDLQNPPECLADLMQVANEGADLVFGRFRNKQHARPRVLASRLVTLLNRVLYGLPKALVVGNVRLMKRTVLEAALQHERNQNYLTGLVLLAAKSPANVWVDHVPRPTGKSSYSLRSLMRLFWLVLSGHPRLGMFRAPARPMSERVKQCLNAEPHPAS